MFSHSCHWAGQLKSRLAASGAVLAAVTKMKAKGTRNTTIEASTAMMPITQPRVFSRFTMPPPAGSGRC